MKSDGKSKFSETQMLVWAAIGLLLLLVQQLFAMPATSAEQRVSEPTKFALSFVDKETGKHILNVEVKVSLYGKGIPSKQKNQDFSIDARGCCTVVFPVRPPENAKFNVKTAGYVRVMRHGAIQRMGENVIQFRNRLSFQWMKNIL